MSIAVGLVELLRIQWCVWDVWLQILCCCCCVIDSEVDHDTGLNQKIRKNLELFRKKRKLRLKTKQSYRF